MNFDLCIYHDPCIDGIASAWIVKNMSPGVQIVKCVAGCDPEISIESLSQKSVVFVDICPSESFLQQAVQVVQRILIIDHHISAYEMYSQFDNKGGRVTFVFDEHRSGCQLTWRYFCENEPVPWFLNYIADRDLWTNVMPNSREINQALYDGKHIRSFEALDELFALNDDQIATLKSHLLQQGRVLVHNRDELIRQSAKSAVECVYKHEDRQYRVWVYTCPRHILSEVGHRLTKWRFVDGHYPDFVVFWQYVMEDHYFGLSFRSSPQGTDVHLIARQLSPKGGGHRRAAGCSLPGGTELRALFTPVERGS